MQKTIKRHCPDLSNACFSDKVSPLLQRIYAARGALSDQDVDTSLSRLLPPDALKGLPEAVQLISHHLQQQNRILIVGDFDTDGATSSALALLALRAMGAGDVHYLVPNRFEFGYGLTPGIVGIAEKQEPGLIITVDNGISSIEGVKAANAAGIQVLVTDHHLPGSELPEAAAIVNLNQPGCTFASKNLAGVGVIFYVMSALRSSLRQSGWFDARQIPEPNMADYLDLVALGTVADVVPLDQNNRIMVEQGLRRIRAGRTRPGIKRLSEVANRRMDCLVSADLGFALGPRLNAAGRLDDMSLGIECLVSDSDAQAREIAKQLDELNRDRRSIESGMQKEAMALMQQMEKQNKQAIPTGLCLYNPQWHQGVIGILASRIKDYYHRPVIAFAQSDNGEIKGSARSIPGFHIRDALDSIAARHPQLLEKFGGHAMAAGLTLRERDLQAFSDAFEEEASNQLSEQDLAGEIITDGELSAEDLSLDTAIELQNSGPWGQHFAEPLFDGVFQVRQQRLVGEKHLKLVLAVGEQSQEHIDAIAFNVDTDIWPAPGIKAIHAVYRLEINRWGGKQSVQLLIEHVLPLACAEP
jgi:single-stranded-DNA-specific exonuclease